MLVLLRRRLPFSPCLKRKPQGNPRVLGPAGCYLHMPNCPLLVIVPPRRSHKGICNFPNFPIPSCNTQCIWVKAARTLGTSPQQLLGFYFLGFHGMSRETKRHRVFGLGSSPTEIWRACPLSDPSALGCTHFFVKVLKGCQVWAEVMLQGLEKWEALLLSESFDKSVGLLRGAIFF